MPNILTNNLRHKNIENFLDVVENQSMYFCFSNPNPWVNENAPDSPNDCAGTLSDVFTDMLYGKRIILGNTSNVIKNYGWSSGSRYQQYDDIVDIGDLTRIRSYIPAAGTAVLSQTVTGTLSSITVTNNGTEYITAPTITIAAPGAGTTATAIATISAGSVLLISITNPGSGYTTAPTVTFSSPSTITTAAFDLRPFYVFTDELKLYKCIDNAGGAPSTTKPTATSTSGTAISYLADGYMWKYMMTLSTADSEKFYTSNWLPVKTLENTDTTDRWDIQNNAVEGSIFNVDITNGGTGYTNGASVSAVATIVNGGTAFAATANISGGIVTAITVTNCGSGYIEVPTITFPGSSNGVFRPILSPGFGNGSNIVKELGATNLMVKVRISGSETDNIIDSNDYRQISIVSNPIFSGSYYTAVAGAGSTMTLSATHVTAFGVNTALTYYPSVGKKVIIIKGTGKGQVRIIQSYSSSIITLTEAWDTVPNSTSVYGFIADATIVNQTVILELGVVTNGPFVADSTVTQASTSAAGKVVKYDSGSTPKKLYLTGIAGTFNGTNGISAGSISSTVTAMTSPMLRHKLGDVFYMENRKPITRYPDQIEDIKVVIAF